MEVICHNGDTGSGGTVHVEVLEYCPPGTLIVVQGTSESGTVTFFDSRGNSYVLMDQVSNPGLWTHNTAYCFIEDALWPGHTIAMDAPGGTYQGMQYTAFWGVESYDQQADAQGTGTVHDSGPITTTYADELLVTNSCHTGFTTYTSTTDFTELGEMFMTLDINTLYQEYRVVDTVDTYESGPTAQYSEYWQCRIISFKLDPNPGVLPITANFPLAAAGDDSSGWMSDTEWPPNTTWNPDEGDWVYAARGSYYDNNGFWRWDTSSLPDDIEIISASLRVWVNSVNAINDYLVVAQWYDFGGEPSVLADYAYNMDPTIMEYTLSDGMEGGRYVFWIDDFSGVNTTGWTGIRMGLHDGADTAPSVDNHIRMYSYENNPALAGQLSVIYTIPQPTFKPRAIII